MKNLIIIIILVIIYIYYINIKENFVGYNNTNIPLNHIPNIYENETTELTNILSSLFKESNFETLNYNLYNIYIEFPFTTIIKKMIENFFQSFIVKKDKITVNSNLNKMYWKDIGNDRIFIFNTTILNNTHFTIRNIKVKIIIKDIHNYMIGDNYITTIPYSINSSINIISIKLDDDNSFDNNTITGIDDLQPIYYQIKNTMHLMDPFYTSHNDSVITEKMYQEFLDSIQVHANLMKNLTKTSS